MSYVNSTTVIERDTEKTGFASYNDVYDIIKDVVDESNEFYEIEPAVVIETLLDPDNQPEFPKKSEGIPDYNFYGCIRARFLVSQSEGDEINGLIRPLSTHINSLPLKGEVVNVSIHNGKVYYNLPLNMYGKASMNRMPGKYGEGLVKYNRLKYNRPAYVEQGDTYINGRFGSNIVFGSDSTYTYPTIKITNRQAVYDTQELDEDFIHPQGINNDGSSIFITSAKLKPLEVLEPSAISKRWPPQVGGEMDGDMISINSDKIVFNAKGDGKRNNSDIHIFAARNINLNSNYEINIGDSEEGGVINLGDPDATNSVVKFDQFEDLIEKMADEISAFANQLTTASDAKQIGGAAKKLIEGLGKLKGEGGLLEKCSSKAVKIADDPEDSTTENVEDTETDEVILETQGIQV